MKYIEDYSWLNDGHYSRLLWSLDQQPAAAQLHSED